MLNVIVLRWARNQRAMLLYWLLIAYHLWATKLLMVAPTLQIRGCECMSHYLFCIIIVLFLISREHLTFATILSNLLILKIWGVFIVQRCFIDCLCHLFISPVVVEGCIDNSWLTIILLRCHIYLALKPLHEIAWLSIINILLIALILLKLIFVIDRWLFSTKVLIIVSTNTRLWQDILTCMLHISHNFVIWIVLMHSLAIDDLPTVFPLLGGFNDIHIIWLTILMDSILFTL